MKRKVNFSKRDILVVLSCFGLVLLNTGAIGSGGRRRAKEMVCLSNLRQWGVIFESYTNDHDGYFNRGWVVGETELWMNALRPYYHDDWNLLLCPQANRIMQGPADWGRYKAAWRDCDLPGGGEHRYAFSYNINSWTNYMTRDRGDRLKEWFWKNARSIQDKGNIPVFADGSWHDAWPRDTDAPTATPDAFGIGNMGTTGDINHFVIDRHNGGINALFMDWSARKVGLKELWTLKWHRHYNTEGPWTNAGGVTLYDWPDWMRNFKHY